MSIRSFFADLFDGWGASTDPSSGPGVNPATGLPMMGGGVDVEGNPFGVDLHRHDDMTAASSSWDAGSDHHHRSTVDDHWSGSASLTTTGWDSSSSAGASSPWPDHPSSRSDGGYDPFRVW